MQITRNYVTLCSIIRFFRLLLRSSWRVCPAGMAFSPKTFFPGGIAISPKRLPLLHSHFPRSILLDLYSGVYLPLNLDSHGPPLPRRTRYSFPSGVFLSAIQNFPSPMEFYHLIFGGKSRAMIYTPRGGPIHVCVKQPPHDPATA